MKKWIMMLILFLLILSGCGNADVPGIEDYTWEMTSVQCVAENGSIIAYGERDIAPGMKPYCSIWNVQPKMVCLRLQTT